MREKRQSSREDSTSARAEYRGVVDISYNVKPFPSANHRAHAFGEAMADNLRRSVGELRRLGAVMGIGD